MTPIPILKRLNCYNRGDPLSILILCLLDEDPTSVGGVPVSQNTMQTTTRHRLHRRNDRNDGVIIGIVFGIVFFIAFICVAIYFRSHVKRGGQSKTRRKDRRHNDDGHERRPKKGKKGKKGESRRHHRHLDPMDICWPSATTIQRQRSWQSNRHPGLDTAAATFELDIVVPIPAPAARPPRAVDPEPFNEMDAPQIIYPDEEWEGGEQRRGVRFRRG